MTVDMFTSTYCLSPLSVEYNRFGSFIASNKHQFAPSLSVLFGIIGFARPTQFDHSADCRCA